MKNRKKHIIVLILKVALWVVITVSSLTFLASCTEVDEVKPDIENVVSEEGADGEEKERGITIK